jgi:aminoglycoside 6'-N-acetyltransferase I
VTTPAIRPAVIADSSAWLAMRAALYGDDPSLKPEIDDFFAGNSPIEAVYIADDGESVGFVELGTRPYAEGCVTSPVAYIEGLFVVPEKRRMGIGRLLVAQAEDWARKCGLTELASDALIDNDVSIAMHKALGFAEVERIVCLRKSLVLTIAET